ncbi:hypothetical protein LB577_02675 [Mesorhizobium sp. B283B1A]|uniref:hypothetical protein n=1 Tax=Mesorhizobium TaxID=68287 RepID=UPI001CD047E4|nr:MULTISPECIES: hypothetical protein [Mesorhizobium]MCA0045867.1 hypothetical protein [Mesorhizobium sp. B283B1A]UQS64618.1 hypothetical protein M5D98_31990 [Mesorhizobium opportunistum]
MSQSFDASRSLARLEQNNTIIAVIEMSKAKWLVTALVPGLKRQLSMPAQYSPEVPFESPPV